MARKKDISALIGGIIGKPTEEAPSLPTSTPTGEVSPELVEALQITPEMEEQLNEVRRAKVGRPRKGAYREAPKLGRATFVVDPDLVRKLKYISVYDSRLLKDIVAEAFTTLIEKWEEANGVINLPKRN